MAGSAVESPTRHERSRRGETSREELRRRRQRRALYSLIAIGIVLAIGTVGIRSLAQTGWVNAFYFESMLATGQGPPFPLTSDASKLFASGMAFLSVGTVIASLILNLGPALGRLWREGLELAERELHKAERELVGERQDSPEESRG